MSAATLATRVKAAREGASLSQRALPGVNQAVISKIEAGKITDPGIATMTAIAKATGKTIDELMGAPASAVRSIELRDLYDDPDNPRQLSASDAENDGLIASIRERGLILPLAVRLVPLEGSDRKVWAVIDGHRRLMALRAINGPKSKVAVPCRVIEANDTDTMLLQLSANLLRADMNPWDLAKAVAGLVQKGVDTAAIAAATNMGRRWVQEQSSVGQHLREDTALLLQKGELTISQAVAIAGERDADAQYFLVQRVVKEKLGEDEIRALTRDRKDQAKAKTADPQVDLEDYLEPDRANDPKPWARKLKWKGGQGSITVQVFKVPNAEEYTHEGDTSWRPPGGTSWGWSAHQLNFGTKQQRLRTWPTPWAALAAALLYGFDHAMDRPGSKKDEPLLKLFIPWASKQYRLIGGPVDDIKKLQDDLGAILAKAYPPKDAPAPTPPKAKASPKLKPVDIDEPPAWALPMVGALFMYHSGREAFLCKGWRHMAKTFSEAQDGNQDELRELYRRESWANDTDGKPFDFGGSVVRLKDAPA